MDSSGHNKLAKTKGGKGKGRKVKPILKMRAGSEKNSLDLDRPLEEQQVPGIGIGTGDYESNGQPRSVRDVSFTLGDSLSMGTKPRFQHTRSPSGASHTSVATAGSAGGPRSVASLELAAPVFTNTTASTGRDYSPTIAEVDDDDDFPVGSLPKQHFHHSYTAPVPSSSSRQGSLSGQRTASFGEFAPHSASRFASNSNRVRRNSSLPTTMSQPDPHLHRPVVLIPPASSVLPTKPAASVPAASIPAPAVPVPAVLSPAASTPVLSSGSHDCTGLGFGRLRSRSEVDAAVRAEQIREARRKFEERERAKEEKHEREMQRKRERQEAAQLRKNSNTGSDSIRPSLSRKSTRISNGSGSGDQQAPEMIEKDTFKASRYDNVPSGEAPSFGLGIDRVAFRNAHRKNSAKHKTQSYWTRFMLWLRTRIFHMGRK